MREAIGNGLTVHPIRNMMNHETNELFFDDLKIPAESLIGEEGKGFRYILDGMNAERILIAAECVGDGLVGGGAWGMQLSEAMGMKGILIFSSHRTVTDALERAVEVIDTSSR